LIILKEVDSLGGTKDMPIYEYGCAKCGKTHEIMQKFSDVPLAVCPDCGGEVKKLISNTSFVLKGTAGTRPIMLLRKRGETKKVQRILPKPKRRIRKPKKKLR